MSENDLAKLALDVAFKVHSRLGPGLLESVYETAMAVEFDKLSIQYTRQQGLSVMYEGTKLDMGFRTDIILEDKLIIEIKSIESILEVHHKTLLTYLKVSRKKLGLLINFNVYQLKDGIHRKIYGQLA